MNKTNKIIGLILIIMILAVVGVMIFKLKQIKQNKIQITEQNSQTKEISSEEFRNQYRQSIKQILNEYIMGEAEISNEGWQDKKTLVKNTLDKILDLRLNSEDKDFHLDLVLILSQLEDTYTNENEVKTGEIKDELQNLITKTDWLDI